MLGLQIHTNLTTIQPILYPQTFEFSFNTFPALFITSPSILSPKHGSDLDDFVNYICQICRLRTVTISKKLRVVLAAQVLAIVT